MFLVFYLLKKYVWKNENQILHINFCSLIFHKKINTKSTKIVFCFLFILQYYIIFFSLLFSPGTSTEQKSVFGGSQASEGFGKFSFGSSATPSTGFSFGSTSSAGAAASGEPGTSQVPAGTSQVPAGTSQVPAGTSPLNRSGQGTSILAQMLMSGIRSFKPFNCLH